MDSDTHRVAQRQKQLDLSHNTLAYGWLVEQEAQRREGQRFGEPSRQALARASSVVADRMGEPDPAVLRSKRAWEGSMRAFRSNMHKAVPNGAKEAGFRPMRDILASKAETDVYLAAEEMGLDLSVRTVWPAPSPSPTTSSSSSSASLASSTAAAAAAAAAAARGLQPTRWLARDRVWVPPPLEAGGDAGAELHERLVSSRGGAQADVFASRLDWAAVEEHWTPGYTDI